MESIKQSEGGDEEAKQKQSYHHFLLSLFSHSCFVYIELCPETVPFRVYKGQR